MNTNKYHTHQRTEQVYRFIVRYKRESGGVSPSMSEIARGTGIASNSTVNYHLCKLEESGRIVRDVGGRARHISIPGERWILEAMS
jgi:SOS-response transcriptional repressor LexA